MSKPRYNLRLRLRACWRILTGRAWALYTPANASEYDMAWQGLTVGDCQALSDWATEKQANARASAALVNELLSLNPGIAPAA